MSAAIVVLVLGVVGLAAVALLLAREPDARVRLATTMGAAGGLLIAVLIALAAGKGALAAAATGAISAAALALALIGQWRLFRLLVERTRQ